MCNDILRSKKLIIQWSDIHIISKGYKFIILRKIILNFVYIFWYISEFKKEEKKNKQNFMCINRNQCIQYEIRYIKNRELK